MTRSARPVKQRFRPMAEALEARDVPSVSGPEIMLTKTVPPGCYAPGATATYTYTVTNPAGTSADNVPLTNVSLTDDNGTPTNTR